MFQIASSSLRTALCATPQVVVYKVTGRVQQWLSRLTEFARVIVFDKRGCGLSDRDVGDSTLEDRMDDLRAVLQPGAIAAGGSGRSGSRSSPTVLSNGYCWFVLQARAAILTTVYSQSSPVAFSLSRHNVVMMSLSGSA